MTNTTHLVTGATGHVGCHLVAELLGAGHHVRTLTRSPENAGLPEAVEVYRGGFDHLPDGLFDGIAAAFVFPADEAAAFARAAAASGVRHLVLLSSLAAAFEHERDHGSASQVRHSAIEEAVRSCGTAWTVLRPGTFANNLLTWSRPIRFTGGVRGPHPTSRQAPIHEADVAAAAAAVLTQPGHEGQIYPMTGPEALTRVEQLQTHRGRDRATAHLHRAVSGGLRGRDGAVRRRRGRRQDAPRLLVRHRGRPGSAAAPRASHREGRTNPRPMGAGPRRGLRWLVLGTGSRVAGPTMPASLAERRRDRLDVQQPRRSHDQSGAYMTRNRKDDRPMASALVAGGSAWFLICYDLDCFGRCDGGPVIHRSRLDSNLGSARDLGGLGLGAAVHRGNRQFRPASGVSSTAVMSSDSTVVAATASSHTTPPGAGAAT